MGRLEEIKRRWGEACLQPNDSVIGKLPGDLAWLVTKVEELQSKGAGYIQDGVKDADDARADTFEEAAKMLAWLAEHGTMPQAVGQAIKDFRAKAKELRDG